MYGKIRFSFLMLGLLLLLGAACSDDDAAAKPEVTSYSLDEALTGTTLTINGKNFGTSVAKVTVTFTGDAEATVTAVTSTTIVVTIPNEAYSGVITITVGNQTIEGPSFTVLTMCPVYLGETISYIPCPKELS